MRPIGNHRARRAGRRRRAQERAAAIATLYPGVVLNFVGKVAWESMIHFDVRIVEVRSSALRDVGVRWNEEIAGPGAGIVANLTDNDPGGTQVWPPQLRLGWAATLDSRLRLLEQRGDGSSPSFPVAAVAARASFRASSFRCSTRRVARMSFRIRILDVKPGRPGSIYARAPK